MPVPLSAVITTLESLAPPKFAEPWDNVGLLVGDSLQRVSKAILCIDYTPAVAEEAAEGRCDLVIAYHPLLFEPVKRFTSDGASKLAFEAARRGVAIYSPHTALDVAEGGTNDVLADAIAMTHRRPLKPWRGSAGAMKLVTFVPAEAVERVSQALFGAGAGVIGRYAACSFQTPGTGTFFGNEGTSPAVGRAGQFERVNETRLEVVLPAAGVEPVVAALRTTHPYEEPAFDLYPLAEPPSGFGIGRVGGLPGDATVDMLLNMLKRNLSLNHLLIAGDPGKLVKRVAVAAGAGGGELLGEALRQKADLYITGELRHHDALRANRAGTTVLCTLHSNSERATLVSLAERLKSAHADLPVVISSADVDPFSIA